MFYVMTITIRRAEERDLEALGRLGAMLMETHYAFDRERFLPPGDSAESGYAWFLGKVMQDPDGCVFVAEEDGGIAGYVYAALEPLSWKELRGPAGFIHDVAVREEARRSGVAARLLERALDWLRERGAPRVVLWSAAPNEGAQRLFRRFGFRQTMVEMTLELEDS
jgi:ribosomal protein S18 acetylase RimI-like enzyme